MLRQMAQLGKVIDLTYPKGGNKVIVMNKVAFREMQIRLLLNMFYKTFYTIYMYIIVNV